MIRQKNGMLKMKMQSAVSVMCRMKMMFDVIVEKSGFNVHVIGGYMQIALMRWSYVDADGKERICSFCVI